MSLEKCACDQVARSLWLGLSRKGGDSPEEPCLQTGCYLASLWPFSTGAPLVL